MGWYAVYYREMLLMYKKMGKFGYIFSSVMFPVIYLFAFGLGLGSRVDVAGGYVPFLAKGILGLTVMINAFQQTSLSVSIGRLHFNTFQTLVLSPNSAIHTGTGIVLAGVTRGVFMGGLIYGMAWLFFAVPGLSLPGLLGLLLSAFCFATLGMAVGLWVSDPDEISLFNNFIITPMIFFCGSFFPIQNLPAVVKSIVAFLPLSLANNLLRTQVWEYGTILNAASLLLIGLLLLWTGVRMLEKYSE